MYFADISAAFLQGDYLPAERRMFPITPKNYPQFVRDFLLTKVPAGSRTDVFRMKKAGFGLAEGARLWYKRFKRDVQSIGERSWLWHREFSFLATRRWQATCNASSSCRRCEVRGVQRG